LKTYMTDEMKNKIVWPKWTKVAFEVLKWAFVLWLLWPVRNAVETTVDLSRIVLGVLLFIIFTGKIFYDTIIIGILRRRRVSAAEDILTLIGIVLVLAIIVGLLIFFAGYLFLKVIEVSRSSG